METLDKLLDSLERQSVTGVSTTTLTEESFKCPICQDRGYVVERRNGELVSWECKCAVRKRNMARIKRSGLATLAEMYTLQRYKTPEPWQQTAKKKAEEYLAAPAGRWFVISGTPGSGKTHLCTAIAVQMMQAGRDVRYMLWREEAPRIKALVNDRDEYDPEMEQLKTVDVLYIDDFLKGAKVSDGDINLAFELLNARYNRRRPTIISGERNIEELLEIDEAIGSRIYERSKGFCIVTPPGKNWRLRA